jgi:hypothetical protein
MASYKNFEELPVWQSAAEVVDGCDEFLAGAPPQLRPSFRSQLERAVVSVSNNIAEGFERGTTNELLAFIYIARGSAGEVRSDDVAVVPTTVDNAIEGTNYKTDRAC